jgi:hypothetical protein
MSVALYVISGIVALAFGVYLGLPGRYDQSVDEIDERLDQEGEHAKAERKNTVITILQRKVQPGSDRRRSASRRKPFHFRD